MDLDDPGETLESHRRTLIDALRRAATARDWRDPSLEAAVRDLARAARAAEVPPERFLIALKRTVRDEALPDTGDWFRDVVLGRAVLWGIEAYYGLRR